MSCSWVESSSRTVVVPSSCVSFAVYFFIFKFIRNIQSNSVSEVLYGPDNDPNGDDGFVGYGCEMPEPAKELAEFVYTVYENRAEFSRSGEFYCNWNDCYSIVRDALLDPMQCNITSLSATILTPTKSASDRCLAIAFGTFHARSRILIFPTSTPTSGGHAVGISLHAQCISVACHVYDHARGRFGKTLFRYI